MGGLGACIEGGAEAGIEDEIHTYADTYTHVHAHGNVRVRVVMHMHGHVRAHTAYIQTYSSVILLEPFFVLSRVRPCGVYFPVCCF